jgi:hypothetical protein
MNEVLYHHEFLRALLEQGVCPARATENTATTSARRILQREIFPEARKIPHSPAALIKDSKKYSRTNEKNYPYACDETLSGRFECDAQLSSLFLSAYSPLSRQAPKPRRLNAA